MYHIPPTPHGLELNCKGWQQEGIYRMLLNSLDEDVAENPQELVVYGGAGKAVRDYPALVNTLRALRSLDGDETLLIQSGKPVAVFQTQPLAPRVIISSSWLVPHWATWEVFWELEKEGLTSYGQATASSWAYIGAQGTLQATADTFSGAAEEFGGSLAGRLVLSSGLGGLGSAQPLAVEMNGGVAIIVEVDEVKIRRRLRTNYCQIAVNTLDEALAEAGEALKKKVPLSIALHGNAADVYPEMLARGIIPDVVTDQTAAHDLLEGYVPSGLSVGEAAKLRKEDPCLYIQLALESICRHVTAMLEMKRRGAIVFELGNNLREQALRGGIEDAFIIPSYSTLYLRSSFCKGRGSFRWIALSGEPADIYRIDNALLKEFAHDKQLKRWIEFAQQRIPFQGLPARACWLQYEQREPFARLLNEMVQKGSLKAPVAITRCQLDGGSVSSPLRETESMLDGSDAIADWPVLSALLHAATGATCVSLSHGGGVGIGYSVHAGMTVVVDGSVEIANRLEQVLMVDPAMSIIRFADAGYDVSKKLAATHGLGLGTS